MDGGLPRDSDGDGIPDHLDADDDNDGVLTKFETDHGTLQDSDHDGTPDHLDKDDDNDGIPTAREQADPNGDGNPEDAVDTDGDGVPDYLDKDDDGDGIPTAEEPDDLDRSGVPDYLEPFRYPRVQGGGFDCAVSSHPSRSASWLLSVLVLSVLGWRRRRRAGVSASAD